MASCLLFCTFSQFPRLNPNQEKLVLTVQAGETSLKWVPKDSHLKQVFPNAIQRAPHQEWSNLAQKVDFWASDFIHWIWISAPMSRTAPSLWSSPWFCCRTQTCGSQICSWGIHSTRHTLGQQNQNPCLRSGCWDGLRLPKWLRCSVKFKNQKTAYG
jgi:hypothetical protein